MSYNINDLRGDLAATIAALRDPKAPMEIGRAKAIAEVAQTIINSAKVEVDMINAVGGRMTPTGFLSIQNASASRAAVIEHAPQSSESRGLPPQGPQATI